MSPFDPPAVRMEAECERDAQRARAEKAEADCARYLEALEAAEEVDRHYGACEQCASCSDCGLCHNDCKCDQAGIYAGQCAEFERLMDRADEMRRSALRRK